MNTLIFTNTFHEEVMIAKLEVGSMKQAELIMEWYGAFYSGDPYTVTFNGREIDIDINGIKEELTIDIEKTRLIE